MQLTGIFADSVEIRKISGKKNTNLELNIVVFVLWSNMNSLGGVFRFYLYLNVFHIPL